MCAASVYDASCLNQTEQLNPSGEKAGAPSTVLTGWGTLRVGAEGSPGAPGAELGTGPQIVMMPTQVACGPGLPRGKAGAG